MPARRRGVHFDTHSEKSRLGTLIVILVFLVLSQRAVIDAVAPVHACVRKYIGLVLVRTNYILIVGVGGKPHTGFMCSSLVRSSVALAETHITSS